MDSQKKNPDYVNTLGIIVIGLAGALLVYISFVGLQAYYISGASALEAERDAEGKDAEMRSLQSEHEAVLKGYRWIDSKEQTVQVPIELAMQRVVEAASENRGATLVPAVGAHDTATVPAVAGRPPDGVKMPAVPDEAAGEAPATEAEGAEGAEDAAAGGEAPAGEAAAAPAEAPAPAGEAAAAAGEAAPAQPAAAPAQPAAAPAQPAAAPAAGGNPGGNGQQ